MKCGRWLIMENILTGILTSAVTAGTVIIIAGVGEILAERTGVMNLGIEGMMSLGAVTGIIVVNAYGGSAWMGLLGAILIGFLTGLLFAFSVVKIKANQLLTGLALTFIGNGLARHIGKSFAGQPAADKFTQVKIPGEQESLQIFPSGHEDKDAKPQKKAIVNPPEKRPYAPSVHSCNKPVKSHIRFTSYRPAWVLSDPDSSWQPQSVPLHTPDYGPLCPCSRSQRCTRHPQTIW